MISSLFHRDQLQPWDGPNYRDNRAKNHQFAACIGSGGKYTSRPQSTLNGPILPCNTEDGKISVRPQMDHIRAAESACRRSPMHCTCGNAPQLRYQSHTIPDEAKIFDFLGIDGGLCVALSRKTEDRPGLSPEEQQP